VSEIAESLETAGIAGCCESSSVASATHTLSPAYFLPYILWTKFGRSAVVASFGGAFLLSNIWSSLFGFSMQ
jgi:hypothetical protein